MRNSFNTLRSLKNILLSGGAHILLLSTLWLSATDITPIAKIPDELIDANILPPIAQQEDKPTQPMSLPAKEVSSKTIGPLEKVSPQKEQPDPKPTSKAGSAPNPSLKSESNSQTAGNDGQNNTSNNSQGNTNNASNVVNSGAKSTASGVPIAVKPSSGFDVNYDVTISENGDDKAHGSGSLQYKRNGDTYQATLDISNGLLTVRGTSEGEVRKNTIATTRFVQSTRVLGKTRSKSFNVDYAAHQIGFASGGMQDLPVDTVYDYLSAIVYLQAVLQTQSHPRSVQINVGKSTSYKAININFGSEEDISTGETGKHRTANKEQNGIYASIPAIINLSEDGSSSDVQTVKVWFARDRQFQPVKIELTLKGGRLARMYSQD